MGSEHYCLRWNNHQSNLLGVFSQLLRDESLVDVTLACSEGHSIRAHKVVLSACSSYFQTLFVDHPSRHPIVILKDVHFAELRTLIEFMYKGEVNVEYCQLPTLLKTAESLKVKGLAEMTNQGTLRQDYKQEQPDEEPEQTEPTELVNKAARQPPPQQSQQPAAGTTTNLPGTATTSASSSSSSEERDREIRGERDRERDNRERERDNRDRDRDRDREKDREKEQQREQRRAAEREHHREHTVAAPPPTPPLPKQICHTPPERPTTPERTRSADTPLMLMNEDCRPSDMTLHNNGNAIGGGGSGTGGGACSTTIGTPTGCNRLTSPILSEPLPGPSNMPPVQQVPLSLKKEVDWGGGGGGGGGGGLGDDKSTGESSSDYPRHSHDPDLECRGEAGSPRIYSCMYCGTTFQHQSKLTRHILSHSLESLKYREPQHHLALGALAAESPLNLIDFSGATRGPPGLLQHEPPDPSDAHASPMDLELAAAAAGDGPGVVLCKFCGKSFPDVSSLITHLPVHTGDRPFKCEFCGKAFKLRHHMKDHCRVHTGERPFRCTLCGKTFSRSTILKAHEKTHYPKYVRKFLSPSPLDTEEESPH